MATHDPEFLDSSGFPAGEGGSPAPRGRGCLFYGCVFSAAALAVVTLVLAIGSFLLYRTAVRYFEMYTSTDPVELPRPEISEERRKDAVERFRVFREAVEAKRPTKDLVLDEVDLNALIRESPKLKDHVYVEIDDDKIKAKVSLPLDDLLETSLTRGRYLNGEADIRAEIDDGALTLKVDAVSVDGRPLPREIRDIFDRPNVVLEFDKDLKNHPDRRDFLRGIEEFEIDDGKVVIKARDFEDRRDHNEDAD